MIATVGKKKQYYFSILAWKKYMSILAWKKKLFITY